VGHRREDGSVFCICSWSSPAQSFSGPSPLDLATIFYCLSLETSLFVASYDSQGHSGGIRPRLHTICFIAFYNSIQMIYPVLSVFLYFIMYWSYFQYSLNILWTLLNFKDIKIFCVGRSAAYLHNHHPGGLGNSCLSGTFLSTCPRREILLVAMLLQHIVDLCKCLVLNEPSDWTD
jgi:hypothetical protein